MMPTARLRSRSHPVRPPSMNTRRPAPSDTRPPREPVSIMAAPIAPASGHTNQRRRGQEGCSAYARPPSAVNPAASTIAVLLAFWPKTVRRSPPVYWRWAVRPTPARDNSARAPQARPREVSTPRATVSFRIRFEALHNTSAPWSSTRKNFSTSEPYAVRWTAAASTSTYKYTKNHHSAAGIRPYATRGWSAVVARKMTATSVGTSKGSVSRCGSSNAIENTMAYSAHRTSGLTCTSAADAEGEAVGAGRGWSRGQGAVSDATVALRRELPAPARAPPSVPRRRGPRPTPVREGVAP